MAGRNWQERKLAEAMRADSAGFSSASTRGFRRNPRRGGTALVAALAVLAGVLVLVIAAGSLFAAATGTRERKLAREAALAAAAPGSYVFDAIGTVRAATRDKPPAIVVATISFPYPAADRAYAEELQVKATALRAAAIAWFGSRTAADLAPAYEGSVKAGLRDAFNRILSLRKVDQIWLSDFSVIQ
jgi:flagellar basal body-associated protein FliL